MTEASQPTYRLEDLKQRWEKNPSSRLYLQLAEEYRKHGRLEEAVAVLRQGLKRRPGDLSAYVALGRYSIELGRMEEATAALEAAVERDPTHLVASKLLLEVHLQRGEAEKAGERLEIYRVLNDRDPELEHLEYRLHGLRGQPASSQKPAPTQPAPTAAEAELESLISGGRQTASEARAPAPPPASAPFAMPAPEARVAEPPAVVATSSKVRGNGNDIFDLGAGPSSVPSFEDFWGPPSAQSTKQPTAGTAAEPAAVEPAAVEPAAPAAAATPSAVAKEVPGPTELSPEPSTPEPFPEVSAPMADSRQAGGVGEASVEPEVLVPEKTLPEKILVPEQQVGAAEEAGAAEGGDEEGATVTLGGLYLKQGHLEEAVRIFEQVLARDPKNHAAIAGLSLAKKPEKTGLTAMDLLADRSLSGTIPAGVTAKKIMILSNYLKHLKATRERNHVR